MKHSGGQAAALAGDVLSDGRRARRPDGRLRRRWLVVMVQLAD